MEALSPPLDEVPGARTPLRIVVSQAGHNAALKVLVAQSLPMLRRPEAFTEEHRRELAHRLARAICPRQSTEEPDTAEPDAVGEPECEPGSWLEETGA